MKFTTLLTSALLVGAAAASTTQYYIGGSFAQAGSDPASATDVFENLVNPVNGLPVTNAIDAINVNDLKSFELGMTSTSGNFDIGLSLELLFGDASDSDTNYAYDANYSGVLFNLKGGMPLSKSATIFGTVGIGSLTTEIALSDTTTTVDLEESVLIYQIMFGFEYKLTRNLSSFVQYRQLSGSNYETYNFTAIDDSFTEAGIRFHF